MHLSISRFAYVDYNIHACIVHSVRYASAPPDAFISNSLIQISYCMHSLCHCYYGTMSDEWCANVEHPATINQCSVQRAACFIYYMNEKLRPFYSTYISMQCREFSPKFLYVLAQPFQVCQSLLHWRAVNMHCAVCTPVVVWRTRLTISHFLFSRDSLTTASNQPHPIYPYITHCTTRSIMPTHRMMTDVLCRCIHTTMLLPCYPAVHMLMLWYTIINSHIMVGTYIRAYTHLTEIITNE